MKKLLGELLWAISKTVAKLTPETGDRRVEQAANRETYNQRTQELTNLELEIFNFELKMHDPGQRKPILVQFYTLLGKLLILN